MVYAKTGLEERVLQEGSLIVVVVLNELETVAHLA